ncbi:MerR family transcriptional regulator [Actinoplanes sp. NPDC051859]|uniref:MerR family transcriptional regulator n=1 Tax=Actinoplanes sp. NPDC051859 TaxID=3363909 RepID=UPI0037AC0C21
MVGVWTMDELVEQVHRALAAEYPGAPNGRVRDVPDRRAIRWYTTTGLVDRPSSMRGRTALYERRHLLQIVALKRRQAQGHSLAAIQAELAGATDAVLAEVALLPADAPMPAAAAGAPPHSRFWATPPAPPAPPLPPAPPAPTTREVGGVALGGGVLLILPVRPQSADHAAIAAAAAPLLDLLAARGLLSTPDSHRPLDQQHTDDGSPS